MILRATVFSIASYGCKLWAMTKTDRKRIDALVLQMAAKSVLERQD